MTVRTAAPKPPFRRIKALSRAQQTGVIHVGFQGLFTLVALTTNDNSNLGFSAILFLFTAPIALYVSLSQSIKGLKEWHFTGVEDDEVPADPTDAKRFSSYWIKRLAWAACGLGVLSLYLIDNSARPGLGMALLFAAIACLGYIFAFWVGIPNARDSRSSFERGQQMMARGPTPVRRTGRRMFRR